MRLPLSYWILFSLAGVAIIYLFGPTTTLYLHNKVSVAPEHVPAVPLYIEAFVESQKNEPCRYLQTDSHTAQVIRGLRLLVRPNVTFLQAWLKPEAGK